MLNKSEKDILDKKIKKTKISQLTSSDIIFGIGLGYDENADDSKIIKELGTKWSVNVIGYCDVKGYNNKTKRFNVSHPTLPFGNDTTLTDDESQKHYVLCLDHNSTGYESFYTLKPETWEIDLVEALNDEIKLKQKYFDDNINILRKKIDHYLMDSDKINNYIKNNYKNGL